MPSGFVRPPRSLYVIAAVILFVIEVLIALYVHDGFVRPYIGDMLVVALVYAVLRAVTPLRFVPALAVTLGIAFAVEFAQLFGVFAALGLTDNQIARIVLGGVFDLADLAAYTAGAAIILIAEMCFRRRA